jgi:molybdopterin converting factor subunit 1
MYRVDPALPDCTAEGGYAPRFAPRDANLTSSKHYNADMKVTVRLFANLHEIVGEREIQVELAEGGTIADVCERVAELYPRVREFLPVLVCAVDEDYAPNSRVVENGDSVALIPPVSGG